MALLVGLRPTPQRRKFGSLEAWKFGFLGGAPPHTPAEKVWKLGGLEVWLCWWGSAPHPSGENLEAWLLHEDTKERKGLGTRGGLRRPGERKTENRKQRARDGQGAVQGGVSRRPIPPTASSEGGFLGKATRRETEGGGRGQRRSRRATDGARSGSRALLRLCGSAGSYSSGGEGE